MINLLCQILKFFFDNIGNKITICNTYNCENPRNGLNDIMREC